MVLNVDSLESTRVHRDELNIPKMQPQHLRLELPYPLRVILRHENLHINQIFDPSIFLAPVIELNI